jgi:hypothetical protein
MASKDSVFIRMNEEFEWIWKKTDIAYCNAVVTLCPAEANDICTG